MDPEPVIDRVRRALSGAWRSTTDIHALTRRGASLPADRVVRLALSRLSRQGLVERQDDRQRNRPARWRLKAAA